MTSRDSVATEPMRLIPLPVTSSIVMSENVLSWLGSVASVPAFLTVKASPKTCATVAGPVTVRPAPEMVSPDEAFSMDPPLNWLGCASTLMPPQSVLASVQGLGESTEGQAEGSTGSFRLVKVVPVAFSDPLILIDPLRTFTTSFAFVVRVLSTVREPSRKNPSGFSAAPGIGVNQPRSFVSSP